MRRPTRGLVLALAFWAAAIMVTAPAVADEWPLAPGDFWEVDAIKIKDGGGLSYATFLATEWRQNQEFAKSKGWIKSYLVLANSYPRHDEPDLYLITITDHVASGAEGEKRQNEYLEWRKKTISQMQKESGDRAQFRELDGGTLLQELKFRQ